MAILWLLLSSSIKVEKSLLLNEIDQTVIALDLIRGSAYVSFIYLGWCSDLSHQPLSP